MMPKTVPPLVKVTAPLGTTLPLAGATVAVKITAVPDTTELAEALSAVVVETTAAVMDTLTVFERR